MNYLLLLSVIVAVTKPMVGSTTAIPQKNVPVRPQEARSDVLAPPADTEAKIRFYARLEGFDEEKAVSIAVCESQLGKYKENWEGSGAYGLYQFKPKTWKHFCKGDIESDDDQIQCFIQLYNKYPHYWECK